MVLRCITDQMSLMDLLEFHKCLALRSLRSLRLIQLLFLGSGLFSRSKPRESNSPLLFSFYPPNSEV